ncbi:hypothetical protein ACOMHN_043127 [Nucella lapillus]
MANLQSSDVSADSAQSDQERRQTIDLVVHIIRLEQIQINCVVVLSIIFLFLKGRPKSSSSPSSEFFKVLRVDKEIMRTRRTHSVLTNRIHAHWRPGSSNLNQGHYRWGQKTPDDVPMAPDDWLTFGGAGTNKEGTEGVIDAFANFSNPETYYNIGGSVGSRVAQQLRKGGRIRIGINGEVVSHDLRIKKWGQGVEDPDEEPMAPREEVLEERERMEEEEEEKEKLEGDPNESVQENPPSPASPDTEQEDLFGDLVRAITIDQNSEEDQRLKDLSIEDVIQTRMEISVSSPTPGRWRDRSSLSTSHHPEGHRHPGWMMTAGHGEQGRCSSSMAALPPGRWPSARGNDSPGSPRGKRRLGVPRTSSSVPFQGTRDVRDLGTFRPAVLSSRGSGSKADRHGSEKGPRPMTGLPVYRGPGSGGVSSINAGSMPGDARFIKISQPIRNPNASPVPLVSGLRSYYSPFPVNSVAASPASPPLHQFPPCSPPRSNTPESMLDMEDDPERTAEDPAPVHVIQAINIPMGGEMEEEEEEEVGEALKGDRGAGDQVDQVAHLLVKAVLAESRVSPLNSFDQDHVAHLLVNAVLPAEHD